MPVLSVDVRARIASFKRSLDRMERDVSQTARRMERAFRVVGSAITFLGGAAAFSGFVSVMTNAVNTLDDLAKKSQGIGVTVEQLSALRYTASFAGVEINVLDNSLAKLNRRLLDAQRGSVEAARAFEGIGVDPSKYNNVNDALNAIADAFQRLPDGPQKTAAALRLFEETGYRLIPLLNLGSEGLREFYREADSVGAVMSTRTAKAAEVFKDNLNRIGQAASAATVYLAGPFIEAMADVTEAFRLSGQQGMSFFESIGTAFAPNRLDAWGNTVLRLQKELAMVEEQINSGRLIGTDKDFYEKRLSRLRTQIEDATAAMKEQQSVVDEFFNKERRDVPQFVPAGNDAFIPADSAAAKTLDAAAREYVQVQEQMQELIDRALLRADERDLAAAETLAADAERIRDAINPTRELMRAIESARGLLAEGLISEEEFKSYEYTLRRARTGVRDLADEASDSGLRLAEFASNIELGFENAIFEGERLSSVLKQLAIDLAKLLVRQTITKPLFEGILGAFSPAPIENRNDSFIPSLPAAKALNSASSGTTIAIGNIAADVSLSQVEEAVSRGVRRAKGEIYDSRARGGAFA